MGFGDKGWWTNKKDLTEQRFGKLVVIKETEKRNGYGNIIWLCKCDCGKIKEVATPDLKTGRTMSCGCLKAEGNARTHNLSKTKIYKEYYHIKNRCYNKNSNNYKYYGSRGIRICDEWLSDFMNFYNWAMANGYNDKLTIDRIDVNGNYEPNNCRWIPQDEQKRNTRRNILYKGKCVAEWLRELKVEKKQERKIYENIKKYGVEQIIKNLIGE